MTGVFEGVGTLQFTPDNKFAYIYSGEKNVNNVETTLFEFTNNSEYLEARFQLSSDSGSSDNIRSIITFNNIEVYSALYTEDNLKPWSDVLDLHMIIPPFTVVKFTATNVTAINVRPHFAMLVAKVHGAIEQENLEAITDNNKWASK
jgi:hypothetical protein